MVTHRTGDRSLPRLRKLAIAAAAVFAVLTLVVIAALVWTSALLERTTATGIRDMRSLAIVDEAEVALLTYQRLSNLYVATGAPEIDAARVETAGRIPPLLERAASTVGSPREHELLIRLSTQLDAFMRTRQRLEREGVGLEDVLARTGPVLSDTVALFEALRRLNEAQAEQARQQAARVNRLSKLTAAGVGVLLALSLVSVSFGVRRYLLRPLIQLHRAVVRFRMGETDVRAEADGTQEWADLAGAFNEMVDAQRQQRDHQLAFLAGVAHDLRNPLGTLKVGLRSLLATDREPHPERRAHLRRLSEAGTLNLLERQVDGLTRMVNDLLDATRIEAGKLDMRFATFDLRQVAAEVVQAYAAIAPDHQIAAELPEEPVIVHGDPLRIEQVASNLVSNAVKFSPGGGRIAVTIRTDGDRALLAVTDHGIGITEAEMPDLFMPFRRHHPEVAGGSGLGLSVVRRIVTAHGGGIDVESEPHAGSTFTVWLPGVSDSRDPAAAGPWNDPAGPTRPRPPVT